MLPSSSCCIPGDLGYLDPKGNLWLVGRLKDMIKSGGENVHAAEVEGMLLTHPAIAAAAVFGLDHERLGEQVAAAVVLQPGWVWADAGSVLQIQQPMQQLQTQPPPPQQLQQPHPQPSQQQQQHGRVVSAAGLQQHCRSAGLSPYKLPRVVVCTQQLPLNSSGKVLKLELKQQVQAMLTTGRSSGSNGLPEAGAGAGAGAVKLRSKL
jgi:acyl-activating enzyme 14